MSPATRSTRRRFLGDSLRWLGLGLASPLLGGWQLGWDPRRELFGEQALAMGTRVQLLVAGAPRRQAERGVRAALREIFAVHESMTLFEPSPLRDLNRAARSQVVGIPADIHAVLERAADLQLCSDGRFDPALGDPTAPAVAGPGWAGVELDTAAATLRLLHPDVAIDLNGIAKGAAVDRAAQVLRAQGLEHFVVNAGGDLYVAGDAGPDQRGWPIHLATMGAAQPQLTLQLRDEAVATSGNATREVPAPRDPGHLIDPRHGRRCNPLRTATALAATATAADGWATALFVAGPDAPRLTRAGITGAVLVGHDGQVTRMGTVPA